MRHRVGVTVHGSQLPPTPPVLHPWLPLWNYIGSCSLLWGANVPWYQRVSCRCQLTLPPTLLSLWAIAFAGPLPLMDPNMGPRWREMAMWGGRTSRGQAGIITWLHAAQEMGESVLAVHPPRALTNTQAATTHSYASYSTPRHPCLGDWPLVSPSQTVCPVH